MTRCDHRSTSATRRFQSWRRSPAKDSPTVKVGSPSDSRGPRLRRPAATPRGCGRDTRDPITSPAMAMASDALSPAAVHNSRSSSKRSPATCHMDSTGDPAQHGARGDAHRRSGRGHRRVVRRRSLRHAPNSVAPRRCRGWSPTLRRACASRRRRADHRRPPDVRRSGRRSRRPMPGSRYSIAAARRRCNSARSDFSCDS